MNSSATKKAAVAASVAALLLAVCLVARGEQVDKLKPQGFVSDFAGVIEPQAKQQLTLLCQEVNQKANAQISVVTIHTTEGIPIEDFSIDLAQRWGVGPRKSDRGVLILLAVNDHRYRIEVGYGLEGILPDGKVGTIGREAVPLLRQQNYSGALLLWTRRVADVIAADRHVTLTSTPPIPPVGENGSNPGFPLGALLSIVLFLGIPMMGWLLPLLLSGALTNPGRRGMYMGRRPWMMGGYWPGTWGGGGFGGGGGRGWGGGGGFGGFGGGSFGGGGASGGW